MNPVLISIGVPQINWQLLTVPFQYIDSFESRGWSKIVSSKELPDRKDKSVVESD